VLYGVKSSFSSHLACSLLSLSVARVSSSRTEFVVEVHRSATTRGSQERRANQAEGSTGGRVKRRRFFLFFSTVLSALLSAAVSAASLFLYHILRRHFDSTTAR
jgi:hypothetical protein